MFEGERSSRRTPCPVHNRIRKASRPSPSSTPLVACRQVEQIHQTYLKEQARFEETPVIADLGLSIQSTEGRKRQGATPGHNPQHSGGLFDQGEPQADLDSHPPSVPSTFD
jgi:hypothetical protein